MVDKFTKRIEAKPITNICSEEAVKFFLDIIYRFGVPNCIITDHETNFTKVMAVLWSLRTTPNRSMGFTHFFLVYGAKAVLPSDLDHGTPRVRAFDQDRATKAQQDTVDLLEEAREMAIIHSAHYQQTLGRYHKRKNRERTLEVGDLILWRTQSTKDKHMLFPPWEGPYTVAEVIRLGTYRLKDDNDNVLTNTWNIKQLHRFFP
ncbi:uncharacterized protein [Miscanthus floridulus]|uniref:uncharacterized protein n=1 Tax=Miscanthus floridulus TaxID=154761 RepID=UPI00345941CC